MPHTSRLRRTVVALAAAVCTAASLTALAAPAGAAGDAKLDKYVVAYKAPGWTPLSAADAAALVSAERQSLAAATSGKVLVAAKGATNGTGRVFVVVTAFEDDVAGAEQNARAAVISTCSSALGESPSDQHSFRAGDAGSEGTCSGTSSSGNKVSVTAISFVEGNSLVLVAGSGASKTQLEALARKQAKALPGNVDV